MKNAGLFIFEVIASMLLLSCNTEVAQTETGMDYSFPVAFYTKGEQTTALEIFDQRLITDMEESEYENTDFFSLSATMIPRETIRYYDEKVDLMAYFPDLDTMENGQEINPVSLLFGYLSNNIEHLVSRYRSGKIIYRGMKDGLAQIEFQDVLFVTAPTRFCSNGEHIISGILKCPVYGSFDEINP